MKLNRIALSVGFVAALVGTPVLADNPDNPRFSYFTAAEAALVADAAQSGKAAKTEEMKVTDKMAGTSVKSGLGWLPAQRTAMIFSDSKEASN